MLAEDVVNAIMDAEVAREMQESYDAKREKGRPRRPGRGPSLPPPGV